MRILMNNAGVLLLWFLPCQVKIGSLTFVVTEMFENPVETIFALNKNVL